jgi:membrane-associated PAP2 superfamily phosphatase
VTPGAPAAASWRRDAAVTLAALAMLLAWEATGWDLALSARYGGAAGFAARNAFWTRSVLHDGGRALAWAVMALVALDAWRPWRAGPPRRERVAAVIVMLIAMAAVSGLKHLSTSSCPWDLTPFGGTVPYVPHGWWGVRDGGPGHCFPSGHAVSAFGFFGLYFLWRGHAPRAARGILAATLAVGALFGWAQLARGAHFVSHTLWSAWACWVLTGIGMALVRRRERARAASARGDSGPVPAQPVEVEHAHAAVLDPDQPLRL